MTPCRCVHLTRGLGYWVPRAMNVRETILNQLTATVLSKEYRCQEKLN